MALAPTDAGTDGPRFGTGITEVNEIGWAGQRGGEEKQWPDEARHDQSDRHV